jgi:hypothetical protein
VGKLGIRRRSAHPYLSHPSMGEKSCLSLVQKIRTRAVAGRVVGIDDLGKAASIGVGATPRG